MRQTLWSELWRPWQMVFGGLGLGPLGPAPTAGTLTTPPPQISLGKWGGIRSPPGLNRQDRQNKTGTPSRARQTGQDSPPGPDRQDKTSHRNQKPSWAGLEAEASSGHDQGHSSGPHRVPQRPPPFPRQGGRRLEWPPWPQQEEPPAPDESPWTRQDKVSLKCSCGHNKTDTRHSWPWHVDLIHGARDSGGQRAWVSANPAGMSQRRSGGHWVRGRPAGIESEAGRWRDLPRMARLGERQPGN